MRGGGCKTYHADTVDDVIRYQNEPAAMPYIPEMRGYVHCTRTSNAGYTTSSATGARGAVKAGSVTMAFLNVDANRSFGIHLNGTLYVL